MSKRNTTFPSPLSNPSTLNPPNPMSHNTRKTFLAYRWNTLTARRAFHKGMTDSAKVAWNRAVQARRSLFAPVLVKSAA